MPVVSIADSFDFRMVFVNVEVSLIACAYRNWVLDKYVVVVTAVLVQFMADEY